MAAQQHHHHHQHHTPHHHRYTSSTGSATPVSPSTLPLYTPTPQYTQHHHHHHRQTSLLSYPWRQPYPHHYNAHQHLTAHNPQLVSPIMSRSASAASDRYSTVSGVTQYYPSNPSNVNPAPAYVAPFGAAQVVSEQSGGSVKKRWSDDEDDDEDAEREDGEGSSSSKDDVSFSEPALALINAFLDQLLYSFLATARSTSVLALRPAVTEVLKHRLAREAIASAEEELAELLAGGDDEEMDTKHKAAESSRRWDLELVWKRTRLRVMVYMRLGEMEDDDEQRYVKEEELFHGSERRFSSSTGLVSWAAAIFLTSVLEYVAEQTLQVAGHAAQNRARRQGRHQPLTPPPATSVADTLVVEEYDVEKVALNSTLGRLWRTWRKALRSNAGAMTPNGRYTFSRMSMIRDSMSSAMSQRPSSIGTAPESVMSGDSRRHSRTISRDPPDSPGLRYPEYVLAANIPLPMGDARHDVEEIEVPGLARDPDQEDAREATPTPHGTARRYSFTTSPPINTFIGLPTPDASQPGSPEQHSAATRPAFARQRSMSVPTPARTPMPKDDHRASAEAAKSGLKEDGRSEQIADEQVANDAEEANGGEPDVNAAEIAEGKNHSARNDVSHADSSSGMSEEPQEARQGFAGGLVAGATAAAAAVLGLATGRKSERAGESERDLEGKDGEMKAAESADQAEPTAVQQLGGPNEEAASSTLRDVRSDETEAGKRTGPAVATAAIPRHLERTRTDEEIARLDSRKSLLEIKSMTTPAHSGTASGRQSPEVMDSKRVSVRTPDHLPTRVRNSSTPESGDSYTLGKRGGDMVIQQQQQHQREASGPVNAEISSEEGPDDAIGVARTSDVPEEAAYELRNLPSPSKEVDEARLAGRKPGRLIIDGSNTDPRTSAEDFLEQRALTPKTQSALEQTRSFAPQQAGPRRSSTFGNEARQSAVSERSSWRQSFSAVAEKNASRRASIASQKAPTPPPVPAPEPPVQQHPVVQRMASLKRKENMEAPLTSASIRGPEDFDMFVQGADTVKYTLTPDEIRGRPANGSAPARDGDGRASRQVQEMDATASRAPKPAPPPPIDTRVGRSQHVKQATAAAANATVPDNDEDDEETRARKRDHRRSISRPPPRNQSAHRKSGLMAREPRVQTESTRDFADFIRSTGPDREASILPIMTNASTTSLNSLRSAHIHGASMSRSSSPHGSERTRSMTRSFIEDQTVPPVPPIPHRARTTLQPRGATAVTNGSSDLIDFIRSGPDQPGQHRISRTVAPFRNTLDSDQFRDMGDRISTSSDRPADWRVTPNNLSRDSSRRGSSSMKTPSQRTSVNSRSALLAGASNAHHTVHPAHSGQPQRLSTSSRNAQQTPDFEAPARKRVRNKDPYALPDDLDDDDEEFDDHLTALPRNQNGRRQEESLMDFLNSTDPPKDNSPRPLMSSASPQQARNMSSRSRQASASSLRSAGGATEASRASRSLQNSNGPRPGYAPSVQSQRSGASPTTVRHSPPSTKPKLEARSPGGGTIKDHQRAREPSESGGAPRIDAFHQTSTNELADFLKNSGPPDDPNSAPAPIVGRTSKLTPKQEAKAKKKEDKKKKVGGLGAGFFSMRTKKKTYLDVA